MEYTTDTIEKLVQFFKTIGDSTRLRILLILAESEYGVSDLSDRLKMSVSAISHQLKLLKLNRLVKSRREGKQQLYSLDDEHVSELIRVVTKHIEE